MDGEKATSHGSTSVNRENTFQLKITSTIPFHFVIINVYFVKIVGIVGVHVEPWSRKTLELSLSKVYI